MDAARQKTTQREVNGKRTPRLAVGRQERRRRTVQYTSTKQAVECVFDQICSFGLYVIRYVMFLCFQVHFKTKQTKCFLAYAMLNIICFYVFMFSGTLQFVSVTASFLAYEHRMLPLVSYTNSYIESQICMTVF